MSRRILSAVSIVGFSFSAILGGGCVDPACAPPPSGFGACTPGSSSCGGGPADPVPDTRDDGAVDITSFPAGNPPAGVILNVPNEGRLHVDSDSNPTYATNPPASGPHFEVPADTGFYCEQLATGHWVHSLEHGYIVVLFDPQKAGPLAEPALRGLLAIAPASPTFGNQKLVITPYSGLAHAFCVVAWNRQLYLDLPDVCAILSFYQTYIDQGPEQEA